MIFSCPTHKTFVNQISWDLFHVKRYNFTCLSIYIYFFHKISRSFTVSNEYILVFLYVLKLFFPRVLRRKFYWHVLFKTYGQYRIRQMKLSKTASRKYENLFSFLTPIKWRNYTLCSAISYYYTGIHNEILCPNSNTIKLRKSFVEIPNYFNPFVSSYTTLFREIRHVQRVFENYFAE